ncbi:hypothetical protein [Streptomyces incanus]
MNRSLPASRAEASAAGVGSGPGTPLSQPTSPAPATVHSAVAASVLVVLRAMGSSSGMIQRHEA